MSRTTLPGYILAGGLSSRFDGDKALARITGIPLLLRLAKQMQVAHLEPVTLVVNVADRFANLSLRSIVDLRSNLGPIGGLWTALQDAHNTLGPSWIAISPCDLIQFEPAWLEAWNQVLAEGLPTVSQTYDAVAFHSDYWIPLPALYHTHLLPLIQQQIEKQEYSLQKLLSHPQANARKLFPESLPIIRCANTTAEFRSHLKDLGLSEQ